MELRGFATLPDASLHFLMLLFPPCVAQLQLQAGIDPRILVAQRCRRDVLRAEEEINRAARPGEIMQAEPSA